MFVSSKHLYNLLTSFVPFLLACFLLVLYLLFSLFKAFLQTPCLLSCLPISECPCTLAVCLLDCLLAYLRTFYLALLLLSFLLSPILHACVLVPLVKSVRAISLLLFCSVLIGENFCILVSCFNSFLLNCGKHSYNLHVSLLALLVVRPEHSCNLLIWICAFLVAQLPAIRLLAFLVRGLIAL